METLVHTAEGELVSSDPFQQVGTRGVYNRRTKYKFIVTPVCVERNKKLAERGDTARVVNWNTYNTNGRFHSEKTIATSTPNPIEHMIIIEKDDLRYFEVPDHILKGI